MFAQRDMPEKVSRAKRVQLASIKEDDEQLTTVARNILRAALFPQHPYALRGKGTLDSVENDAESAYRFSRPLPRREKRRHFRLWECQCCGVKQILEDSLGT
jgi:hypothetical protein